MRRMNISTAAAALLIVGAAWGIAGSGGDAVARPDGVENAERSGGTLKPAAEEAVRCARLGQKREQLVAIFGEPKRVEKFVSGIESLEFQNDAGRMLVEISPKSQKVIQIYYRKKTPFTDAQLMELLNRNAEGGRWIPSKEGSAFIRSDGGMARGCGLGAKEKDVARVGDEYQFVVLTGSEVRRNKPEVADAWKKEVEAALKELEGY